MKIKNNSNQNLLSYVFNKKLITITISFIIVFLFSMIGLIKIPLEIMPKENVEPFLYLTIKTNNASLEFNESEVTLPTEGVLRSLPNITNYSSTVSSTQVNFFINYRPKTDMDLSYVQLQESLQSMNDDIQANFQNVTISKFNPDAVAVIKLSIANNNLNAEEYQTKVNALKEQLESINEIAKIESMGDNYTVKNYLISKNKFSELKANSDYLFKKLGRLNFKDNIGKLTSTSNTKDIPLTASFNAAKLSEVEKTTIIPKGGSTISDISQKSTISSQDVNISKSNNSNVIFFEIYNKENSDLLQLQDNLKSIIEHSNIKHNFKIEILFDRTDDLKNAIYDVRDELIGSIIITFFVILFFLRNLKITLIICISIPISILVTIGIIFLAGKTLNILTLSGLILSIGLTVDNSIVMAERIEGLKNEGLDVFNSCVLAIKEIAMPLFSSTLTSIIIFLPAAFIENGDSFTSLLKVFQFPVIISLLVSYFIALFFIPLIVIIISKLKSDIKHMPKSKSKVNNDQYQGEKFVNIIKKVHSHKIKFFIIIFLIIFGLVDYIKDIEEVDLDTPIEKSYSLKVKFGQEISKNDKKTIFLELEKKLLNQKSSLNVQTIVTDFSIISNFGNFTLYPTKNISTDEEIIAFKKNIHMKLSGLKLPAGALLLKEGEYSSDNTIKLPTKKFTLEGPRRYLLIDYLDSIKKPLMQVKGVVQVNTDNEESGSKYFFLNVSLDKMKSIGLTSSDISQSFSSLNQSIKIENILEGNSKVNVEINIKSPEQIDNLDELRNHKVYFQSKKPNSDKMFIALKELGIISESKSNNSFTRNNGVAKSNLTIYYDKSIDSNVTTKISSYLNQIKLPKGIVESKGGNTLKFEEMKKNSNFIISLSIFLIYLLLASLFESILIPFAIIFTVPLSFIFGIFGLKFLGYQLDPMARLGLLILVGTAVSNAIILVDMIGKLRCIGIDKKSAIIMGTSKRIDAVFMSTTASVLGLLPVALGSSKIMGIPYSTLGVCIISGLIFSACLTLFILPIFYKFFTDIEESFLTFRKDVY